MNTSPTIAISQNDLSNQITAQSTVKAERLYYMDWLRVLAFSLLILVHSSEVFSSWKFFINNDETSVTLGYVLKFFAQWRMPLLFIVSGAAVVLALKNRTASNFLGERFVRIIIPLVAGMLFVIPPQIYYSWLNEGYQVGFWDFYKTIVQFKWFPNGNLHWLHLWYLAFIFAYTVGILPLLFSLRTERGAMLIDTIAQTISRPAVLFILPIMMALPYYAVEQILPSSNPSQLVYYFPYFLFGVLFVTNVHLRKAFAQYKYTALILGFVFVSLLYLFFWIKNPATDQPYINLGLSKSQNNMLEMVLSSANTWQWLIVIWGFAMKYLNKGSKTLTYANQAVFPFYIFHQTVIVIVSYYVIQLNIGIFSKFLIVLGLTIAGIWILFEIMKQTPVTRAMFGMKIKKGKSGL